jgi:hypothetical protein
MTSRARPLGALCPGSSSAKLFGSILSSSLSCVCTQSPYRCSLSLGSGNTAISSFTWFPWTSQDFRCLYIKALQAPELYVIIN